MVKIIWLTKANNDLIDIYNYILEDSPYYARKTVNEIIEKVEKLYEFPYMGRKVSYAPDDEYRELIYKSYRIIYKIKSFNIYIHRIWHSARKIETLFLK